MKDRNLLLKRIIFVVLIVLTSLIIFGFSAQNGEQSSSISKKIAIVVTNIFNPNGQDVAILQMERIIRKLAHFSIYALLGIWTMAFIDSFNIKEKNKIITSIIFGFLYACSDELHQSFVGGRQAAFLDVIIDTLGFIFGLLFLLLIKETYKMLQKHYKKIKKEK